MNSQSSHVELGVHATTLMKLVVVDSVDHPSLRRSGGGRHAVPRGRKEPASVTAASACDSLVHGARGRGRGLRGFLKEAGDHHKRREDPHRRAQQQGESGCSPHVHEEPGGRGVDYVLRRAAVFPLICGSDATGTPAQLNEAPLIVRKICRERTCHRCLDLDLMLEDAGTDPGRRDATSWQVCSGHDSCWRIPCSKPIRHEHVVWELHPQNGELDTRGFGDGSLKHGRMKRLARGGWGLAVLNVDMKVMAKLHGPLPGLRQDITLAESVAFLWYLRHVSAVGGTF